MILYSIISSACLPRDPVTHIAAAAEDSTHVLAGKLKVIVLLNASAVVSATPSTAAAGSSEQPAAAVSHNTLWSLCMAEPNDMAVFSMCLSQMARKVNSKCTQSCNPVLPCVLDLLVLCPVTVSLPQLSPEVSCKRKAHFSSGNSACNVLFPCLYHFFSADVDVPTAASTTSWTLSIWCSATQRPLTVPSTSTSRCGVRV